MATTRAREEITYAAKLLASDYIGGFITDMELLSAIRRLKAVYKLLNR